VGTELHRLARGIDDRPVAPRGLAKQISAETTFDVDLTAMTAVHDAVARITEAAHRRLVSSGRAARTVTVKVRSAGFTTHTRSETAALGTTDLAALTAVAQRLARTAVPEGGVRLIGVSLAGLGEEPPPALFDEHPHGSGAVAGTATPPAAPDGVGHAADRSTPSGVAPGGEAGDPVGVRPEPGSGAARTWRAGDDVTHPDHGHGWVQGAGHGRVTVRFETRSTGPGRARTLDADDPALRPADPVGSLA
jgi:DNA polymerase-4